MTRLIFTIIFLVSYALTVAQELNYQEIKQTRSIQELLISNPDKAYQEALAISKSKNELFSFHGKYYIANYYYNKSELIYSKKLLLKLIDSIEKSNLPKSSKAYQDLL